MFDILLQDGADRNWRKVCKHSYYVILILTFVNPVINSSR